MWYKLTAETGYLKAELYGRETAEETREFLRAVEAAFAQHRYAHVLIAVHSSNAVFAVGKFGLSSYFERVAGFPLKVALLGDSDELRIAHEYIESLALQRGVNLRAFRDETTALRWLQEPSKQPSKQICES